MFDLTKVKWQASELTLLEKAVNIVDAIKAEVGKDDEDPDRIDLDDMLTIVRTQFGNVFFIIRHFFELGDMRAALDEATDLVVMLKRYYGLLDEGPQSDDPMGPVTYAPADGSASPSYGGDYAPAPSPLEQDVPAPAADNSEDDPESGAL